MNGDPSRRETRRALPLAWRGAVALASFVLPLLIAEVLLRLRAPALGAPETVGRLQERDVLPSVPYMHPPGSTFRQIYASDPRGYFDANGGVEYVLNEYGFRDDPFVLPPTQDLRIAFLGDSFCFGMGVHRADTLEALHEEALRGSRPLESDWRVDSFCLPGFNTVSEVALYRELVRQFQPDVLVVWYFLNDVNLPPDLFADWKATQATHLGGFLRRSRVLDLVLRIVESRLDERRLIAGLRGGYEAGSRGRVALEAALDELAMMTRADGVPVALAVIPWLWPKSDYPFAETHELVAELARQRGFAVVDLLPALEGRRAQELWVHATDHHANELASRLFSRRTLAFFESWIDENRALITSTRAARALTASECEGCLVYQQHFGSPEGSAPD